MAADTPFSLLDYIPAYGVRHSEYDLGGELKAPLSLVRKLLEDILLYTPTGFNSQPVRMVLLTGKKHVEHWDIIAGMLIRKIGEERYKKSNAYHRIEEVAKGAVGTVLFFDDPEVTERMMRENPRYKDNFPAWAHQAQGSHQFMTWLGLRALGYGANLQHYIGMEDHLVKEHVGVPESWNFIAHMMFGSINEPALPKGKNPIETMLKVF